MSRGKKPKGGLDTGQKKKGEEKQSNEDVEMKETEEESVQNRQSTQLEVDWTEDMETADENKDTEDQKEHGNEEEPERNNQQEDVDCPIKGFSFEMEYEINEHYEHYVSTSVKHVGNLLEAWDKSGVIEGVITQDKSFKKKGFVNEIQEWMIPPKIVKNKNSVTAEIIMSIKTKETAYSLFTNEKDYCRKHNIYVSAKNTIMEFTNKIGFLIQTYVKIASPKYYIDDLSKKINVTEKIIDVRKAYTYDKGERSKVLVVYATENEASSINNKLSNAKYDRYKYISYKGSSSDVRLVAMQANDMKQLPARYEIMYNASLTERLNVDKIQVTLEAYLMSLKEGKHNYFIAAEQGAGKYQNHVTVIINPKRIVKAKQWLMNVYHTLDFVAEKDRSSSVNDEKYKVNTKYKEELIEFLRPTLESKEAAENKKYGKKLKTYAQALGIKVYNSKKETPNTNTLNKKKKSVNPDDNSARQIQYLTETVKRLGGVVDMLVKKLNTPLTEEEKQLVVEVRNISTVMLTNEAEEEVKEGDEEKEIEKDNGEGKENETDENIGEKGKESKFIKNKDSVNNKRRNFSTPIIPIGDEIELSGTFEDFNQWQSDRGIQKTNNNSKRFKHNHESK